MNLLFSLLLAWLVGLLGVMALDKGGIIVVSTMFYGWFIGVPQIILCIAFLVIGICGRRKY